MSGKTVVITGASTGIGYVTAQRFLREGWQVFGSVRKAADADRLQQELGGRFTPLLFDVTDGEAIRSAAAQVGAALGSDRLGGLVNNAGVVVGGPLLQLPEADLQRQLDVNVMGPFRVTQAFAPMLGADRSRTGKPGRVVQISSVSGSMGFPFLGPYCASKHALNGMSESLRRELMLYGIAVVIVAPGAIETPIWQKTEDIDVQRYAGTDFAPALGRFAEVMTSQAKKHALPPERVADDIWSAITAAKPRLRYEPIPRKFQEWTLPRLLPKRMVDGAIAKMFGLRRLA